MSIVISVVIVLVLLYLLKDRIVMSLFNTQKSKFIFIASYVIKVARASIKNDEVSIYASLYLNSVLLSKIANDSVKDEYVTFFKTYLITYYESSLVDSIAIDSLEYGEDMGDFVKCLSLVDEIEYSESGEAKLQLAFQVLSAMSLVTNVLKKNLTQLSTILMDLIEKFKES